MLNQLLDRFLAVVEIERTTRQGYAGKAGKHIRLRWALVPVGRIDAGPLG